MLVTRSSMLRRLISSSHSSFPGTAAPRHVTASTSMSRSFSSSEPAAGTSQFQKDTAGKAEQMERLLGERDQLVRRLVKTKHRRAYGTFPFNVIGAVMISIMVFLDEKDVRNGVRVLRKEDREYVVGR